MTGTMTRPAQPETQNGPQSTVTPFLMFAGQAEAAINFYKTVFPDTQVESMTKYKAGENGKEGSVKVATVVIAGQHIMCTDSPVKPDFDFTPSFSFFFRMRQRESAQGAICKTVRRRQSTDACWQLRLQPAVWVGYRQIRRELAIESKVNQPFQSKSSRRFCL